MSDAAKHPEVLALYHARFISHHVPNLHQLDLSSYVTSLRAMRLMLPQRQTKTDLDEVRDLCSYVINKNKHKLNQEETFQVHRKYKFKLFPIDSRTIDTDLFTRGDNFGELRAKYHAFMPQLSHYLKTNQWTILSISRACITPSKLIVSLQYFWEHGQYAYTNPKADTGYLANVSFNFFNVHWKDKMKLPFFVLHLNTERHFYLCIDSLWLDYYKTYCSSHMSFRSVSCFSYMPITRQFAHPNYPLFITSPKTQTNSHKYIQRLKMYYCFVWFLMRLSKERLNTHALSSYLLDPSPKTDDLLWEHCTKIHKLIHMTSHATPMREILRETYQWHTTDHEPTQDWRKKRKGSKSNQPNKKQKTGVGTSKNVTSFETPTETVLERIIGFMCIRKQHYITPEILKQCYQIFFPPLIKNPNGIVLRKKYPFVALTLKCLQDEFNKMPEKEQNACKMIKVSPCPPSVIDENIQLKKQRLLNLSMYEDMYSYEKERLSESYTSSYSSSGSQSLPIDSYFLQDRGTSQINESPLGKYMELVRKRIGEGLKLDHEDDLIYLTPELMVISLYNISHEESISIDIRRNILNGIITFPPVHTTELVETKTAKPLIEGDPFGTLLAAYKHLYDNHLSNPMALLFSSTLKNESTTFYKPILLRGINDPDASLLPFSTEIRQNPSCLSSLHSWFAAIDLYHLYFTSKKNSHVKDMDIGDFARTPEQRAAEQILLHPIIPHAFCVPPASQTTIPSMLNTFIINPKDIVQLQKPEATNTYLVNANASVVQKHSVNVDNEKAIWDVNALLLLQIEPAVLMKESGTWDHAELQNVQNLQEAIACQFYDTILFEYLKKL